MTIDELKSYLRIDGSDDDLILNSLISASDIFIRNGTGNVDKSSKLYELASKLLITHWYENREIIGKADSLSFSLESILMQLKYSDIPAMPTGLVATNGNLSWAANTETDLSGYHVYQNGVKVTDSPITATNYQISGIGSFQVSAVDTSGNESPLSIAVNVTI